MEELPKEIVDFAWNEYKLWKAAEHWLSSNKKNIKVDVQDFLYWLIDEFTTNPTIEMQERLDNYDFTDDDVQKGRNELLEMATEIYNGLGPFLERERKKDKFKQDIHAAPAATQIQTSCNTCALEAKLACGKCKTKFYCSPTCWVNSGHKFACMKK